METRTQRQERIMGRGFGILLFTGSAASALSTVGITLYRFYYWLKFAAWPTISLYSEGGPLPHQYHWAGIQKIAEWFINLPLEIPLLLLVSLLWSWGEHTCNSVNK